MTLSARIGDVARRHGGHAIGARQRQSSREAIPAPIRGWNTRDALAAMKPDYALNIDNYFPESGVVRLRRGHVEFASGLGGAVETLIPHSSGTVHKLIGAANGNLWDVDATPSSLGSGLTSNRWQGATFGGHTILVNGADAPQRIEPAGTLAAAHGWTGITNPENLTQVLPFKSRLFFVEKDSAKLWYGPVAGVMGALTEFDLGLVVQSGGNVVAMGTLTLDSGFGVDDLFCAFFESGEVAVYQGTDISDLDRFGLVGVFNIGAVVGGRPLVKLGGDLIAITSDGYVPVRSLLGTGREGKALALSDAISSAVSDAARLHKGNFGWQGILHTPANWLLFNVPAGGATVQHVMNTQTGAWCRFKGMPAKCWARFNDRLYWGGDGGKVYQADVGFSDGGSNIVGDVQTAYHYFRSKRDKRFTLVRPLIESRGTLSYAIGTSANFEPFAQLEAPGNVASAAQSWSDITWANWKWGNPTTLTRTWRTITRTGAALSIRLRTATRGARVALYATDVQFDQTTGISS